MPRKGNLQFIPSGSSGAPGIQPLDLIPDEVKRDAEEVFLLLQTKHGRVHLEFDTEAEVKEYKGFLTAYCDNRPKDLDVIRRLFFIPAHTEEDEDGNTIEVPDVEVVPDGKKTAAAITKAGPVRFRQSPNKANEKNMIDYRITEIPPKDAATTAIQAAVEKVTEGAAKESGDVPAAPGDVPSAQEVMAVDPNTAVTTPKGRRR